MYPASGVGPEMGDIEQGVSSTQTIQNITEKEVMHYIYFLAKDADYVSDSI